MTRYMVVGGGVAGTTAAQNLRRLDPAAAVVLVGDEPYPYYYRPKLWEFIAGQAKPPDLYYRPADWYAAQKIDLRVNAPVNRIQPKEHLLTLASGESLPFDRLLLAVGACCFVPDIPGADLPGVFVLRTLQDAAAIRAQAARSRRAVVVGGGLLGLETARALCRPGLDVTVVEIVPHLLPRQLDREGAGILQAHLEDLGMAILTGCRTAAVTGPSAAAGIRLEDGRTISGELVLFSAGVVPRIDLARDAGLPTGRGIIVNSLMQSGEPDIFATLPSAMLKLLGMDLTSLGEATADDPALVVRRVTDEKACVYKKVVLRDGIVVGAILLNSAADVPWIKQLIASRRDVSAVQNKLLDPAFDMKGFVADKPVEPRPG
jgi:nitrite reductase (NADH) large subunit